MFKLSSLPIFVLGAALLGLTACDGGVFNLDGNAGKTCSTNPYLPGCDEDPIHQERQVHFCTLPTDPEDSPDDQCVTINVVNTDDIDGYTDLPTDFDGLAEGATSGFVQITGSEIATTSLGQNAGEDTVYLASGNTTDGYAYGIGPDGAIAGILSTTDVGRPHSNRTANATYSGTYTLGDSDGLFANARRISFTVAFNPRTITTVGNIGVDAQDGRIFTVDATFNPYGHISGTFGVSTNTARDIDPITGSVQGLIGTEGAVGALHGNNAADDNPVAGGFVATPQ
ncbi:MAG: hypothetical protein ACNYPD_08440 [Candidatus Halichondribacter symbioticus]